MSRDGDTAVFHVCLDEFERRITSDDQKGNWSPELWHQAQVSAYSATRELVLLAMKMRREVDFEALCKRANDLGANVVTTNQSVPSLVVFLHDDNHHLRSMRKRLWRLCRGLRVGFVQAWFTAEKDTCLCNNARRSKEDRVEDGVIERMATSFEAPQVINEKKESWEWSTISFSEPPSRPLSIFGSALRASTNADEGTEITLILACLRRAAVDMAKEPSLEELRAAEDRSLRAGREANASSLMHQIDLRLRKRTGMIMKAVLGEKSAKREAAALLQAARKDFSSDLLCSGGLHRDVIDGFTSDDSGSKAFMPAILSMMENAYAEQSRELLKASGIEIAQEKS